MTEEASNSVATIQIKKNERWNWRFSKHDPTNFIMTFQFQLPQTYSKSMSMYRVSACNRYHARYGAPLEFEASTAEPSSRFQN